MLILGQKIEFKTVNVPKCSEIWIIIKDISSKRKVLRQSWSWHFRKFHSPQVNGTWYLVLETLVSK